MRFRYDLLYRPYGLSLRGELTSQVLPTAASDRLEATLSTDIDSLVLDLDRHQALGRRILTGLLPSSSTETIEESLAIVRKDRAKYGKGPFLVVKAYGEYEWTPSTVTAAVEGVTVDLDGPVRGELFKVISPAVQRLMCSLFLATPNMGRTDLVAGAGFFLPPEGPVIYPYQVDMKATMHLGSPITPEAEESLRQIAASLSQEDALGRVVTLIADSLDNDRDPLRAFLSGWWALEILVNKLFPSYEAAFATLLSTSHNAPGHQHYLRRVREVMKDRVRLNDKFAVLTAALLPETAEAASLQFKELKKRRDTLLHGGSNVAAPLPHKDPALLAKQLFTAHLKASA